MNLVPTALCPERIQVCNRKHVETCVPRRLAGMAAINRSFVFQIWNKFSRVYLFFVHQLKQYFQ